MCFQAQMWDYQTLFCANDDDEAHIMQESMYYNYIFSDSICLWWHVVTYDQLEISRIIGRNSA